MQVRTDLLSRAIASLPYPPDWIALHGDRAIPYHIEIQGFLMEFHLISYTNENNVTRYQWAY